MNKYIQYVIIGLLVAVIVQSFLSTPDGFSKQDVDFQIKIHDLEQDNALLTKQNNQLEYNLKKFEYEILQNDSIIDNASISELDSMFSDYFKR